jgi:S1-C subfamily serine protease
MRRRRRRLPPTAAPAAVGLCLLGLAACAPGPALAQHGKPPPLDDGPQASPGPGRSVTPPRAPSAAPGAAATAGKPPPLPPGSEPPSGFGDGPGPRRGGISTGTGFIVGPGRVMTNAHVAEGCPEMRLRATNGREATARVVAGDAERDLALLAVQGAGPAAAELGPPLRFRSAPTVRRGEAVVTYGFPLANILSSGPTLTTGDVSALSGLRDNQAHFQISAPVQQGNSGGPLFDLSGNVVGVVTSKLNAQRIAQTTGDIPQNVNFAVKGTEAIDFLRRNGVQPLVATSDGPLRGAAAEVGDIAHPSTLFLRCAR